MQFLFREISSNRFQYETHSADNTLIDCFRSEGPDLLTALVNRKEKIVGFTLHPLYQRESMTVHGIDNRQAGIMLENNKGKEYWFHCSYHRLRSAILRYDGEDNLQIVFPY